MQRWEYLIVAQVMKKIHFYYVDKTESIKTKLGPEGLSTELNMLGTDGWEVCGYATPPKEAMTAAIITFKRPLF